MKIKSQPKNQSGMILILAVILIAVAIGGAVLFSNLIIRDILQSRLIDQSIQSRYLAESGVERALQQIRHREAVRDCRIIEEFPDIACNPPALCACQNTGFCTNEPTAPCVNIDDSGLSARGDWSVNATNTFDFSIVLKKGDSFQIDLFNPFQSFKSDIGRLELVIDNLQIYWNTELINLTKILNVTNPQASDCLTKPPVLKEITPISFSPFPITSVDRISILEQCSYTFKFGYPIDEYDGPVSLVLNVFNKTSGAQLPIPGRLLIDSESIFGNSFQRVKVRAPVRPSLSGLYDFVLFSEEKIEKN
ncbi:MAG: hypothetical protein CMI53_01080 [Parcubacteria group bacterium]|nr:hypothetical protein [Parcubacteria group bacterium]|tara:strand:- start:7295 stop:8212 length:918 start_codon:yes stop_codon:yes gene_type:complete